MASCERFEYRMSVALVAFSTCFAAGSLDVQILAAADDDVLVRAKVVDDATDRPIQLFRVLPGTPYDGVRPDSIAVWQPHLIREAKDGKFIWPSRRSYANFRLRFEADGYKPFVSQWLKRDGGAASIEVRLQRDPGIHLRVMTPDNRPAAGAVVAMSMTNRTVQLKDGRIAVADEVPEKLSSQWRRPPIFIADDLGRCRLPTETDFAVLVLTHDSGFADLSTNDLEFDQPIQLRPWGSVDGIARWHDQVGKRERLTLIVSRDYHYPGMLSASAEVTTDDEGRFQFNKLPPGRVQLSRIFELPDGNSSYLFPYLHFEVEAGAPTEIVFGGDGQALTGNLVGLDSWKDVNVRITPNTPRPGDERGMQGFGLVKQSNIGLIYFTENQPVKADGTFRIEGVLPGYYQLFISSEDRRVYSVRSFNVTPPTDDNPDVNIGEFSVRPRGARNRRLETIPVQAVKRSDRVTIAGTVVDDVTDAPVEKFIIQGGKFNVDQPDEVQWGYFESRSSNATGRFRTTVQWQKGWTARIIADGYLPQPVITKAPPLGKDRVETQIRLKPGDWVYGRVRNHLGKPAVGVSIRAVGPTGVDLGNDRDSNDDALRATTDANGQFELQVGQAQSLVATSDELKAWPIAMPKKGRDVRVTLPAPAKLVVFFDIEGAGEEQQIFWQLLTHRMEGCKRINMSRYETVKRQVATVFSGMTPGEYQVARYRRVRTRQMGFGRMLDRQMVTLAPGETKAIRFVRNEGTRVNGIVKGLKEVNLAHALIFVRNKQADDGQDDDIARLIGNKEWDACETDDDGHFTTELLPPGTYLLRAEGYPPLPAEQTARLGIIQPTFLDEVEITIPESGRIPQVVLEFRPSKDERETDR